MLTKLLFELKLALKFLFIKPRGFYRLARFFTIATIGVSIAALLICLSAFEGYKKVISKRYLDSTSHIIVSKRYSFSDDIKKKVSSIIGEYVSGASYSGYIELMLSSDNGIKGVAFHVVDTDAFKNVIPITDYIVQGNSECLFKERGNIIVGHALAKTLNVKIGDAVKVVFQNGSSRLKICAISNFGLYDIDSRLSWMSIGTAVDIFPEADFYSSLRVRLNDGVDIGHVMPKLQEALGYSYETRSWEDINYGMLESIKMDRLVIFFILGILIAVSVFNIFATLTLLIRELRTDIAVLNVIGLDLSRTLRMFFLQALVLGVTGYLIGILLWLTSLWAIRSWGIVSLPQDVYLMSKIPVGINAWDLLSVFCILVGTVCLACAVPLLYLFKRFKREGDA